MRYKILLSGSIYAYFLVVSRSSRTIIFDCTHPHSFLTIHTNTYTFIPAPHAYGFLGKFPGHKAENHALCHNIYVSLPCFPVSPYPCTLSHPSEPIHAHLYLFAPAQTLNCTAYMYIYVNLNGK